MRILSFVIVVFLSCSSLIAQSPHGSDFKIDCSDCHSELHWTPLPEVIKFSHNATSFGLTGQHKTVNCSSCHESLIFSKAVNNCLSCHKDIHQNSVDNDCSTCHSTVSWIIPNITEMHQRSRFPLLGNHLSADCIQCHVNYSTRRFEPISVECYNCHRAEYNNTVNPNHRTAGFSTDCNLCHSINNVRWENSNFVHDFFPLIGGHKISNCIECHSQSSFIGLSADCYSCHRSDFENPINNPNHISANFSRDCKSCHNINAWSPASFNHNTTQFPLTGKHTTVSCQSCHSTGYSGTPQDCYACHRVDYDRTNNNPNHIAANFPKECLVCHTTNGWSPSTFNHDGQYFPIYSGKHRNEWGSCSDCHRTPNTFSIFSCIDCHEHQKTKIDSEHNGVSGYSYNSNACLNCHPNGSSDKPLSPRRFN